MRRHGMTLASLVVFVAACSVWGWSHRRWDRVGRVVPLNRGDGREPGMRSSLRMGAADGRLWFQRSVLLDGTRADGVDDPPRWVWMRVAAGADQDMSALPPRRESDASRFDGPGGFRWVVTHRVALPEHALRRYTRVVVPLWSIALIGAVLPALWLRRRLRRAARRGCCVACGYDLRATPGRCPECGTVPAR